MIGYSLLLFSSCLACILLGIFVGGLVKQHRKEPFRITQAKDLAERLFSDPRKEKEPDLSIEELKENQFYK